MRQQFRVRPEPGARGDQCVHERLRRTVGHEHPPGTNLSCAPGYRARREGPPANHDVVKRRGRADVLRFTRRRVRARHVRWTAEGRATAGATGASAGRLATHVARRERAALRAGRIPGRDRVGARRNVSTHRAPSSALEGARATPGGVRWTIATTVGARVARPRRGKPHCSLTCSTRRICRRRG